MEVERKQGELALASDVENRVEPARRDGKGANDDLGALSHEVVLQQACKDTPRLAHVMPHSICTLCFFTRMESVPGPFTCIDVASAPAVLCPEPQDDAS